MEKILILIIIVLQFVIHCIDISSLPFTISSSGTYDITQDLTISSGSGITIDSNDVEINGHDYELTHSLTGNSYGIEINDGLDNILIKNVKIIQSDGSYSSSSIFGGEVTNTLIKDNYLEVSSISTNSMGMALSCSGNGNHVEGNTFDISGVDRFYGFSQSRTGPWNIHNNIFNVHDHTMGNCANGGSYPYVLYCGSLMNIYENKFNIVGQKVNVIAAYGRNNVNVFNNTIDFECDCGDGGSSNWEIYQNKITVTSTTSESQYVIRVRGLDGKASNNNKIYRNVIDTLQSSGSVSGISLGDNFQLAGTRIYLNIVKTRSTAISYYGSTTDGDIYCNTIESQSYVFGFPSSDRPNTDQKISNNKVSTTRGDGMFIRTYPTNVNIEAEFCNNGNITDCNDAFSHCTGMTFTTGSCQNGYDGCWNDFQGLIDDDDDDNDDDDDDDNLVLIISISVGTTVAVVGLILCVLCFLIIIFQVRKKKAFDVTSADELAPLSKSEIEEDVKSKIEY